MINMTFDEFANIDDKIAELPPRTENYGLTEKDLNRLESDPERYYHYILYLLNQPYYEINAPAHRFFNKDALPQNEASKRLNAIIRNNVNIED